jgi:hypothetical protein
MDAQTIIGLIGKVTRKWAKQRKMEERSASAQLNRRRALVRSCQVSVKDAVNESIEEAYLAVSSNNTLPAHARQIMYDVRRRIQSVTDLPLDDAYFTQSLLPEFMRENPDLTAGWDVAFDARGHFTEPHTSTAVALGTLEVREHLHASSDSGEAEYNPDDLYPTHGPEHRYGAILFVEKEGFMPLFRKVKLAERFDIAIMSTKGQSVIASRQLVDYLCGCHDIPLLVLHDFDKSGFSICGTLSRSSDRYQFQHRIRAIDLGLRLIDVEKWNLQSESFCTSSSQLVIENNLIRNGATPDEAEFISAGRRVELNAFTSGDIVKFLEEKLSDHGIAKVLPDPDTQAAAFRRALKNEFIRNEFDALKDVAEEYVRKSVVPDLTDQVADMLTHDPAIPWDEAIRRIARSTFNSTNINPPG